MGLNLFKNEDKRWGAQGLFTPVDSGLKGVAMTFSDWSEATTLSNDERQALQDAKSGQKTTKMSASDQRKLIRKAKEAEKKAKQAKKDAEARKRMDKKTGTKRY